MVQSALALVTTSLPPIRMHESRAKRMCKTGATPVECVTNAQLGVIQGATFCCETREERSQSAQPVKGRYFGGPLHVR